MNSTTQSVAADSVAHAVPERARILGRLLPLFGVSGIAALIYQICWQRLLFVAFGVDVDSVTIIVSTFMLGLGLGALVGGHLADRFPRHALTLFAAIELGIGVFGCFSAPLIRVVGAFSIHGSLVHIAIANFLLLLWPTMMMGATLPILVSHVVRAFGNVGVSIGLLYFVNTLGAAIGAAATGFVTLYYLGLSQTIYVACLLNLFVAVAVWVCFRRSDA